MAYLITTEGEVTKVSPKNGQDFKLEELQDYVGGLIQIIELNDRHIIVLNEEGKLIGLQPNLRATQLASPVLFHGDFITGNVVVCKQKEVN